MELPFKHEDIKEMTDEQCLSTVLQFLDDRVSVSTGLLKDEDTGNVTHQVVRIECGDFVTVSQPQPLETPLRVAGAAEIGATVQ